MVGKLQTRSNLVGPSGACKGAPPSNLILDIYRETVLVGFIFFHHLSMWIIIG